MGKYAYCVPSIIKKKKYKNARDRVDRVTAAATGYEMFLPFGWRPGAHCFRKISFCTTTFYRPDTLFTIWPWTCDRRWRAAAVLFNNNIGNGIIWPLRSNTFLLRLFYTKVRPRGYDNGPPIKAFTPRPYRWVADEAVPTHLTQCSNWKNQNNRRVPLSHKKIVPTQESIPVQCKKVFFYS